MSVWSTKNILIMHIAKINILICKGPISRIDRFKTHLFHESCNLCVGHHLAVNKRLFYYHHKIFIGISAKSQYIHFCFFEISIVQSDSI